MSDDVLRIRTPIAIQYQYSAGPRVASHLLGLMDGRFVGKRCPNCHLVYMPPRNGTCAKCGVLLGEDVEVGQRGTITTFCIVNVPFLGQTIKIPYVSATILLDGADMGMQHLIQEVDAAEDRDHERDRGRRGGHAGISATLAPAFRWNEQQEYL